MQDALRGVLSDIKAMNASMQHNITIQAMPPDVQRFMYEQFQELEQTVTSQREAAAQSLEIRYYLCDHLGTPHALIREDTGVEWAVQLDAWGNVRVEHNPGDLYQPIRLPGQHADGDTGLYYNRNRYYESGRGEYINQDAIGHLGGANSSAYVNANPVSGIDSVGLFEVHGYPSNVFDKRKYPDKVRELYGYASELQSLITKHCQGNKKIQDIFDKWVVKITNGSGNPVTDDANKTSTFPAPFFDSDNYFYPKPGPSFVFMHEFMHLTDAVYAKSKEVSVGTYMNEYFKGKSNDLPAEKMADQFVRDLMNGKCSCL